jgi:hypothetical protein
MLHACGFDQSKLYSGEKPAGSVTCQRKPWTLVAFSLFNLVFAMGFRSLGRTTHQSVTSLA